MKPAIAYPASAVTPAQRALYAELLDGLLRDLAAPPGRPLPPIERRPQCTFACDCGRSFDTRRSLTAHAWHCRRKRGG
jgi:hypothetical protein